MRGIGHIYRTVRHSPLIIDSIWALIGNAIGKLCALIAGIFVARFLGRDIYGEYSVIRNTLFIIAVFSTLGLGYSATKFIAEYIGKPEIRSIIKIINKITIYTSGIIAVIVFFFSDTIAALLKIQELSSAIKLLAIIIIFNAITTTQIGVLAGFKAFKTLSINNIYSGLITLLGTIILTLLYNFNGALLALLIAQIFNCIINWFAVRKILSTYTKETTTESGIAKKIISFSIPIALQESLYSVSSWIIMFIMANYSNYGQIGINSAVTQWINIIMFIPSILRNVILAYLSGMSENSTERAHTLKSVIIVNFVSTAIPVILVIAIAQYIISLYGPSFSMMKPALIIGITSTVFNSLNGVLSQEFIARGKNWSIFIIGLCRECIYIIITYTLLVTYNSIDNGALYVSIAYTSSIIVALILSSILYMHISSNHKLQAS